MLLLDTHVLVWLASDQKQLSDRVRMEIRDTDQGVSISSITALELALLQKKGRLELPLDAGEYLHRALSQHGVMEIEINADILLKSAGLPDIHNDPFDRILIATAQLHNMILVTKDGTIPKYPELATLW